jgi:hypothetical protein
VQGFFGQCYQVNQGLEIIKSSLLINEYNLVPQYFGVLFHMLLFLSSSLSLKLFKLLFPVSRLTFALLHWPPPSQLNQMHFLPAKVSNHVLNIQIIWVKNHSKLLMATHIFMLFHSSAHFYIVPYCHSIPHKQWLTLSSIKTDLFYLVFMKVFIADWHKCEIMTVWKWVSRKFVWLNSCDVLPFAHVSTSHEG